MSLLQEETVISDLKRMIAELSERPELEHLLDMEQSILENGIDSMRVIQLVVMIEGRYNIAFDDDELTLDNFSTLRSIRDKIFAKFEVTP
ncbi:acyl carrier protein [Paenibacillus sp. M1]|uniref:Acyl carrier protein n=1 Tax=Paenibacillus haidiansis TaxID=1574488 RepID=A0ABU7VQR5_9BACL